MPKAWPKRASASTLLGGEARAVGAEPAGALEQRGGLAPHRGQVGVDGAAGVVGVAHLEDLALAQVAERRGDEGRRLAADPGGQLGGPGEDVVAGHHGVVDALDGVDGGAAAAGGGVVEDVVVHQRADLHELDGGRRVDDPIVEGVAGGGGHDREQRPEALAARRGHPHRRRPEQGAAVAERRGDAVVDGREPVGQVGEAEQLAEPGGRHLGRWLPGGAGEGGHSNGRGGVHRLLLTSPRPRGNGRERTL